MAKLRSETASDQGEIPTARAITERLAKIRKDVVKGGGSTSSALQSPVQASAPRSKKPAKRIKKEKDYNSDEVTENEVDDLSTDNIIKEEPDSPSRQRLARSAGKRNYAQMAGSDDEGAADTGSDFGQAGDEA